MTAFAHSVARVKGLTLADDPFYSPVVLLPTVNDEPGFLVSLFREVLPELCPKLFPTLQRGTWALARPYEMDAVIQLQERAAQIQETAAKEIERIHDEIARARSANAYMFELVRGTGAPLVAAVKAALAELGVKDVVDVDEQMKIEQQDSDLREDLQICDRSPLLTVDIKGLSDLPADSDALQAHKHASIRMQEYGCTTVAARGTGRDNPCADGSAHGAVSDHGGSHVSTYQRRTAEKAAGVPGQGR